MQPGWGGVGRVREEGKATSDVPRESRRGRAWRYPRWGVGRGQHLAIKWRRVRKIVVPFRAPHTDQSDPGRAVERRTWVVIVGFPPPISTASGRGLTSMAGALTVCLPDMASPRSGDWLGSDAPWIAWAITRNQLDLRRLMWNIVIARGRAAMTLSSLAHLCHLLITKQRSQCGSTGHSVGWGGPDSISNQ